MLWLGKRLFFQSSVKAWPITACWGSFPCVFTFSPADNLGKLETEVVEFLKLQQLSKEKQQAMGALVAVGVGLLLLFSLSEK